MALALDAVSEPFSRPIGVAPAPWRRTASCSGRCSCCFWPSGPWLRRDPPEVVGSLAARRRHCSRRVARPRPRARGASPPRAGLGNRTASGDGLLADVARTGHLRHLAAGVGVASKHRRASRRPADRDGTLARTGSRPPPRQSDRRRPHGRRGPLLVPSAGVVARRQAR